MRKSKFTDSQIIDAVKRVEAGFAVPDICREQGISTATFYKWRAKYGGMDVSMMSRMKELEEENRRLKKMYLEEKLKAENSGRGHVERRRRRSGEGFAFGPDLCRRRSCRAGRCGVKTF
jgi:putative transposase